MRSVTCAVVGTVLVVKVRLRMFVTSVGELYGTTQDLFNDDILAIYGWTSPELVLDGEDHDAFFAGESSVNVTASCKCLTLGAVCFLYRGLTHPTFLLICCNLERERVMLL